MFYVECIFLVMKTFSSVFHIILNFGFMMAEGGGGLLSENVGHHGWLRRPKAVP